MRVLRVIGSIVLGGCGALFLLGGVAVLVQGHPEQLISIALALGLLTGAWFLWPRRTATPPGVPSGPTRWQRPRQGGMPTAFVGDMDRPASPSAPVGPQVGGPPAMPQAFGRPSPGYVRPAAEPVPQVRVAAPPSPPAAVGPGPRLPRSPSRRVPSYAVGGIVPGVIEGGSFVAIDVETANADAASICAIGVAQVRGGVVTVQRSWLVRPPSDHGQFLAQNVRIHGITAEQVARDGQSWPVVLDHVMRMIGTDVVVAHNASFDINVVKAATTACGLLLPAFSYVDSLALARRVMPQLAGHSLPKVAAACGVAQVLHHHAGDDARVCAEVLAYLLTLSPPPPVIRPLGGWEPRGRSLPPNADADSSHVLFGSFVTITGVLHCMTRTEARERLASLGANHRPSVSKKTDYLVVGAPNGAELTSVGGDKLLRARQLQADGHRVQIIDEGAFVMLLNTA